MHFKPIKPGYVEYKMSVNSFLELIMLHNTIRFGGRLGPEKPQIAASSMAKVSNFEAKIPAIVRS